MRLFIPPAIIAAVCLLAIGACTLPPQGVVPLPPMERVSAGELTTPPTAYCLNVNDEIELRFPERPDLNQTQRLPPDGRLAVPYLGTIKAEGNTVDQIQATLKAAYQEKGVGKGLGVSQAAWEYRIEVGDELEIRFPYSAALNQTGRVRPDGKIALMLIGTLKVDGLTMEELDAQLHRLYGQQLRRPELTVNVRGTGLAKIVAGGREIRPGLERLEPVVILREHAPLKFYVGGEVARPGLFSYRARLTVFEAIIEAGGHKPTGELGSVLVLRKQAQASPLLIRRDLRYGLDGFGVNDIWLEPFDIVLIPKTRVASVAEVFDQYLNQLLPFLRNSSLGFSYYLNDSLIK